MRGRINRAVATIGIVAAILTFGLAAPSAAHEERTVAGYDWAVGFGDEPTFVGYPNSVQLLLGKGGKPVTKLPPDLKVAVEFGDASKDLELEPNFEVGEFGTPGDYRAFFIPTRPGTYTFHFTGHFTGRLGGTSVDESFTSGPSTFSEAASPTSQEFPVQDPTTGEIAQRIEREVPRLTGELNAATSAADDKASTATTIAIIGLVAGLLGVGAGGLALARARRRA